MHAIEMLALLTFVAPFLYYGPGFLERHSRRITETLEINSAFVVVIVPLSLAILLVHQVARLASAAQAGRVGEVTVTAAQSESAS